MINDEESIAKLNKNQSDNEEVKNTKNDKQENIKGNPTFNQNEHNKFGPAKGKSQEIYGGKGKNGQTREQEEENEEETADKKGKDKYCLNLHGSGYKNHTSKGRHLLKE
jgi:hypothetical protein